MRTLVKLTKTETGFTAELWNPSRKSLETIGTYAKLEHMASEIEALTAKDKYLPIALAKFEDRLESKNPCWTMTMFLGEYPVVFVDARNPVAVATYFK